MSLSEWRLHNQGIAGPDVVSADAGRDGRAHPTSPEQVVSRLLAVQSQDYLGAAWGVGVRAPWLTKAHVDAAFDAGRILRTHVLRPTWHFVTPDDAAWLLELTAPRVQALNATMYRRLGLDAATLGRADEVMVAALAGGNFLTREELKPVLAAAGLPVGEPQQLTYLVMHAELSRSIISGPRRGKSFTYAAFAERAPETTSRERDEALAELARRYTTSRGPVTERDLARWSGLTLTDARRALAAADLEPVEFAGARCWLAQGGEPPRRKTPDVHLLSVYDEYLAGYKGWEKVCEPAVAAALLALGNALTHVIVLDGRIIGSWRRDFGRSTVTVEPRLLVQLDEAQRTALGRAAERYAAFFGAQLDLLW